VTSSTGTHTGRFGYGGPYGYQEDEGGLKQLGHRLYDPVAGRFVTKDPIKHGRNWYAYCDNNALKSIDPTGLEFSSVNSRTLPLVAEVLGAAEEITEEAGIWACIIAWFELILGRFIGAVVAQPVIATDSDGVRRVKRITLYRAYGGGAKMNGRSWSTQDPSNDPDYGYHAGLPKENAADKYVVGSWDPSLTPGWVARPSLPNPDYPGSGGAPEILFPIPPLTMGGGGVTIVGGGALVPPRSIRMPQ